MLGFSCPTFASEVSSFTFDLWHPYSHRGQLRASLSVGAIAPAVLSRANLIGCRAALLRRRLPNSTGAIAPLRPSAKVGAVPTPNGIVAALQCSARIAPGAILGCYSASSGAIRGQNRTARRRIAPAVLLGCHCSPTVKDGFLTCGAIRVAK